MINSGLSNKMEKDGGKIGMYRLRSDARKQTQEANITIHLCVDSEPGCSVRPPDSVPVDCGCKRDNNTLE